MDSRREPPEVVLGLLVVHVDAPLVEARPRGRIAAAGHGDGAEHARRQRRDPGQPPPGLGPRSSRELGRMHPETVVAARWSATRRFVSPIAEIVVVALVVLVTRGSHSASVTTGRALATAPPRAPTRGLS